MVNAFCRQMADLPCCHAKNRVVVIPETPQ